MSFRSLLNQTVEVTRKSRTSDGRGGFTSTTATTATYNGRLQIANATDILRGEKICGKVSHVLFLAPEASVKQGDILVIDNVSVEVMNVQNIQGHHFEILCREFTDGS